MSITVLTKPNSYVGLMGVDSSTLMLKKGNDIEKSSVFEELDKYNVKTREYRKWYGGRYESYSDFEKSGAVIITNAQEENSKFHDFLYYMILKTIISSLSFTKTNSDISKHVSIISKPTADIL